MSKCRQVALLALYPPAILFAPSLNEIDVSADRSSAPPRAPNPGPSRSYRARAPAEKKGQSRRGAECHWLLRNVLPGVLPMPIKGAVTASTASSLGLGGHKIPERH